MKLYNQLLLHGLAGIILKLTIVSVQRGTCAIIKIECCVYIPDLSDYISATLDDMKSQVNVMFDDNLPFWTSVLSWVKGDWWKTIFTIVIVALIVLLCGPFILQCIGEGNGTPLQYSCLENPMDGGAWKAAVHGGR